MVPIIRLASSCNANGVDMMRLNIFLSTVALSLPVYAELPCNLCPLDEQSQTEVTFGLALVDEVQPWMGSSMLYSEDGTYAFLNLQQEQRGQNGEFFSNRIRLDSPEFNRWDLSAGKQGSWSLDISVNSFQMLSSNDSQTVFSGVGSNNLSLPDSWVTGSTTSAMASIAESLTPVELSMQHQDLLIVASRELDEHWQLGVAVTERKQDGIRDVGGMIGTNFANARVVVLPAFTDSTTTDFELSANYIKDNTSLQFSYLVSNYDQAADSVTWENPYSNQITEPAGEISLAPNNSFHQLSVNGGHLFSAVSRLNFSLAYGQYLQDQPFSPYTVNNLMLFDDLPTDSLDGQIDSLIANIRYARDLNDRLSFDVSYRYDDQDNQTDSELYNYVIADTQVTATARSNLPYSYQKQKLRTKLRYRVSKATQLQAGLVYTDMERDNQEVKELTSDEIWTRVNWRPSTKSNLSLRFSQTKQRGSEYGTLEFLTTTPENPLLRKYNLADQDRNRVLFVASRQIGGATSLGLRLNMAEVDYPDTQIGLTETSETGAYIDLSYSPMSKYALNIYLGQDSYESEQAGSVSVSDPDWLATIDEQAISAGLDFSWISDSGTYEQEVGFNVIEADLDVKVADSAFPNVSSSVDRITYEGTFHSSDVLKYSVKLLYERYSEDDWATDDIDPDTISNILALGEESSNEESLAIVLGAGYRF
jgi:MtrB/PioB family decaheme-associated outer membrane protein